MDKKKVAILTFFNRLNYGADLQAYALNKIIRDMGYDCEVLDVLSTDHHLARSPEIFKPLSIAKNIIGIKSYINKKLSKSLCMSSVVFYGKRIRTRKSRFDEFKKQFIVVF